MANLGSENTPIEGESFGLPSGYSFDEENGDLVIRDADGTVAMRRADGTWELESDLALNENDISEVGAFDSESVNTEQADITEGSVQDVTDDAHSIVSRSWVLNKFSTVADFERDGLIHFRGDTHLFDVTKTNPAEGLRSLESSGETNTVVISTEGDGLQRYPRKGDVFSCVLYGTSETGNNAPAFAWGVDGTRDDISGYQLLYADGIEEFFVRKYDGQSYNDDGQDFGDGDLTGFLDQWIDFEVEWHDGTELAEGTMQITAYEWDEDAAARGDEIDSIQIEDDDFADNVGIWFGVEAGGDPRQMGDYYRITGSVGGVGN